MRCTFPWLQKAEHAEQTAETQACREQGIRTELCEKQKGWFLFGMGFSAVDLEGFTSKCKVHLCRILVKLMFDYFSFDVFAANSVPRIPATECGRTRPLRSQGSAERLRV